jgi:hypothetical protein
MIDPAFVFSAQERQLVMARAIRPFAGRLTGGPRLTITGPPPSARFTQPLVATMAWAGIAV